MLQSCMIMMLPRRTLSWRLSRRLSASRMGLAAGVSTYAVGHPGFLAPFAPPPRPSWLAKTHRTPQTKHARTAIHGHPSLPSPLAISVRLLRSTPAHTRVLPNAVLHPLNPSILAVCAELPRQCPYHYSQLMGCAKLVAITCRMGRGLPGTTQESRAAHTFVSNVLLILE